MIERLTSISELPVDQIQIRNRLRDVSPDGVATLVEAIRDQGFVGRIVVRRKKDGDSVLDGAHRLTAMRELGVPMIPCDAIRCSDDEARMFEIDGNLAGADLTALDEAYFLAKRREAVQKLRPETRQGQAGASTRWMQLHFSALARTIAEKRGIKERQVYNIMAAGSSLSDTEYRQLRTAPDGVTLNDLLQLKKVTSDAEREYVVRALAEGTAKKAAAARKAWAAENLGAPPPMSPVDADYNRLRQAFERASKAAKRRFVDHYLDDLTRLVEDAQGGPAT